MRHHDHYILFIVSYNIRHSCIFLAIPTSYRKVPFYAAAATVTPAGGLVIQLPTKPLIHTETTLHLLKYMKSPD